MRGGWVEGLGLGFGAPEGSGLTNTRAVNTLPVSRQSEVGVKGSPSTARHVCCLPRDTGSSTGFPTRAGASNEANGSMPDSKALIRIIRLYPPPTSTPIIPICLSRLPSLLRRLKRQSATPLLYYLTWFCEGRREIEGVGGEEEVARNRPPRVVSLYQV